MSNIILNIFMLFFDILHESNFRINESINEYALCILYYMVCNPHKVLLEMVLKTALNIICTFLSFRDGSINGLRGGFKYDLRYIFRNSFRIGLTIILNDLENDLKWYLLVFES